MKRLRPRLEQRAVKYFDYIDLFNGDSRALTIEDDGHPTPLAYEIVADRLAHDLGIAIPTRDQR